MDTLPVRLVIADDHPVVLDGLLATLSNAPGLKVVGVAQSFEEIVELLSRVTADVAVLDLSGMGGAPLTAIRDVRAAFPYVGLVVFSSSIDLAPELLDIGVDGYVIKEDMTSQLITAIQAVAHGRRFISPTVQDFIERTEAASRDFHLAPNELQILRLLSDGLKTVDIAREMNIDPRTVQNYINIMRRKLGCEQRTQLVIWYQRLYGSTQK